MFGSLYFAGFFRLSVRFLGKIQNSGLWVCVFCFDCFSVFFFFLVGSNICSKYMVTVIDAFDL